MTALQDMQRDLALMKEFLDTKWDTHLQAFSLMDEEQKRLNNKVRSILDQGQRDNLTYVASRRSNDRPRVQGGKYDSFDHLDLIVAKSLQRAMEKNPDGLPQAIQANIKPWGDALQGVIEGVTRALDSTTAGSGDELVPTGEANALWADVNLQTAIASLFTNISMPTNPFELPLQLGDVNWFPGTPNIASTPTDPATAKQTLTAQELVAAIPWALDLDEDAVIAMMGEFRALLVRNAAEVWDDVLLNADTTVTNNINADGATISVSDAGKAQWLLGWDGLRHRPLVDNTGQGIDHNANVSDDMFNEVRSKLDKYGVRPSECVYVVGVNTFIRSQSIANLRTLDKFGPQAAILNGQLAAVEGIPVIVSEHMRLADVDGLVTDSGNVEDNGAVLMFNHTQFRTGMKRELMIETSRDVLKRQTVMVASWRLAFLGRNTASADTSIAELFNITNVS